MIRFMLLILILSIVSTSQGQTIKLDKYKNKPQSITQVKIASCSVPLTKWDKEANWNKIESMVREAAQGGALLVMTPEGALDGYVINEVNREKDDESKKKLTDQFLDLGEPLDGNYIKKSQGLSDELDIFFVLGFLERRDDFLYNTSIMIDPDGDIIGRYRKTHFAQGYNINPPFYKAGDEYPVFDTPFGKIGMMICYDRQLPEPARILALKGAQILLVPSFGSYDDGAGWNTMLLRTRAYENRFPLVFSHPKQSLLITRKGGLEVIGKEGEVVYYAVDTSPERYEGRFSNRRPSTYSLLNKGNDPAQN